MLPKTPESKNQNKLAAQLLVVSSFVYLVNSIYSQYFTKHPDTNQSVFYMILAMACLGIGVIFWKK
jgi:hypothetical protein